MTVRIFRSTDINAPVLTGQVGSLISLLDSLLVNGYSTLAVASITRSGATATVTLSVANSTLATGDRIAISGAGESDYNIEAPITVLSSTQFTYQVANSPTTPATGTILYKKAGMGWTKPYAGTNLASYRQPAGTSQFYLRVDDTGTVTARWLGYESMSDVNTGTGPFPTAAQVSGGLYQVKSSSADATQRPWVLLTNDKIFYLFANHTSATPAGACVLAFGDFTSYKAGDAYGCCAIGSISATNSMVNQPFFGCNLSIANANQAGHYVARDQTGVGSAIGCAKITNASVMALFNGAQVVNQQTIGGNSGTAGTYSPPPYPSPIDAGLYVERIWLVQSAVGLRGELPGLWAPMHVVPLANGDTYSGTGALAGKKFEAYSFAVTYNGQIHLETSDTW